MSLTQIIEKRFGPVSIKKELIGGLTTFFTMSYIVIVNPAILSTEGTGMPFPGVLTATVLLCLSMTLLMGLYANLPFAVAPGMGINAFFTFSVILSQKVPWPTALGVVFWAGIIFLVISMTGLREALAKAIPQGLRVGSAVGIGLFLTFIGFKNMSLVVSDPVTFVKLGPLHTEPILGICGLFIISFFLLRKNPFSFLIGIISITIVSVFLHKIQIPEQIFSTPDFSSVFFKMDIWGALKISMLPTIFSIMLTDLFDSISTFVGVSHATGLTDTQGEPKNLRQGLIVDAWATLTAGLFGTSSGTAYIESAAGIEAGARTGLSSIFTAICFLPCFFIAPIAGMIPAFATAPVLVIVGALMFRSIRELKLDKIEDLIPAFLTVILIPLTFSITQGLLWGFISHVFLYVLVGRRKEISVTLYAISGISILLLCTL